MIDRIEKGPRRLALLAAAVVAACTVAETSQQAQSEQACPLDALPFAMTGKRPPPGPGSTWDRVWWAGPSETSGVFEVDQTFAAEQRELHVAGSTVDAFTFGRDWIPVEPRPVEVDGRSAWRLRDWDAVGDDGTQEHGWGVFFFAERNASDPQEIDVKRYAWGESLPAALGPKSAVRAVHQPFREAVRALDYNGWVYMDAENACFTDSDLFRRRGDAVQPVLRARVMFSVQDGTRLLGEIRSGAELWTMALSDEGWTAPVPWKTDGLGIPSGDEIVGLAYDRRRLDPGAPGGAQFGGMLVLAVRPEGDDEESELMAVKVAEVKQDGESILRPDGPAALPLVDQDDQPLIFAKGVLGICVTDPTELSVQRVTAAVPGS